MLQQLQQWLHEDELEYSAYSIVPYFYCKVSDNIAPVVQYSIATEVQNSIVKYSKAKHSRVFWYLIDCIHSADLSGCSKWFKTFQLWPMLPSFKWVSRKILTETLLQLLIWRGDYWPHDPSRSTSFGILSIFKQSSSRSRGFKTLNKTTLIKSLH